MNHCPLGPRHCRICRHQRYGPQHKAQRAAWARAIRLGSVTCARCGQPIAPGTAWDLDHLGTVSHPSHATCNRGDGARNSNVSDTRRGLARGSARY